MFLGEILVANNLVSKDDVERALARQQEVGGLLGENLVALGLITDEALQKAMSLAPQAPGELKDTGLSDQFVLSLMLKFMYVKALETPSELAENIKLPVAIIDALLEFAKENQLVQVLGSSGLSLLAELRYDLTDQGRARAMESMQRSQYLGPAPVPLATYITQIERQHLSNERVSREDLVSKMSHLVLPSNLVEEIGPAANSAKAVLFYGPPGSGKTSIAECVGRAFKGLVYIPYAIEIDGQIITIFDPTIHAPLEKKFSDPAESIRQPKSLLRENIDLRWVPCRRPTVMAGGELRMEMLDLKYSADAGLYEAPLQIKAMNGIFIIDDFGRQMVNPRDLLNRWIVPLEKRFDFLHLHTGRKFLIPFDVLIVFSTNLAPEDLMDEAFLRRIPYKVLIGAPTIEDYIEIFQRVCAAAKIHIPSGLMELLLKEFYDKNKEGVASYHPKFLIDRVIDRCRYQGDAPKVNQELLMGAWRNLFIEKGKGKRVATAAQGIN